MSSNNHAAGSNNSCILLQGVILQNATWDKTKEVIQVSSGTVPEYMPVIRLNPVDKNQYQKDKKGQTLFSCPVYIVGEDDQLTSEYIVTHLDLPTDSNLSLLMEKNVYLTCKI